MKMIDFDGVLINFGISNSCLGTGMAQYNKYIIKNCPSSQVKETYEKSKVYLFLTCS